MDRFNYTKRYKKHVGELCGNQKSLYARTRSNKYPATWSRLEVENTEMRKERDAATDQSRKLLEELQECRSFIRGKDREISELKDELLAKESTIWQKASSRVREVENEMKELTRKVTEKETKMMEQATRRVMELEKEMNGIEEAFTKRKQAIVLEAEEELESHKGEIRKLERTCEELSRINKNLRKEKKDAQKEVERRMKAADGAKERVESLEDQYNHVEKKFSELMRENRNLRQDKMYLEDDIGRKDHALSKANSKIEDLKDTMRSYKKKFESKHDMFMKSERMLHEANNIVASLERKLQNSNEEKKALRQEIVEMHKESVEAVERCDELEAEREAMAKQRQEFEAISKRIASNWDAFDPKSGSYTGTLHEMMAKFEDLQMENQSLNIEKERALKSVMKWKKKAKMAEEGTQTKVYIEKMNKAMNQLEEDTLRLEAFKAQLMLQTGIFPPQLAKNMT